MFLSKKETHNQMLCCKICIEKYSNTNYPVALGCGHTICKLCSEMIYNQTKKCPFCKKSFELANRSKNFELIDIIDNQTAVEAKKRTSVLKPSSNTFCPNKHELLFYGKIEAICVKCKTSSIKAMGCVECNYFTCIPCSDLKIEDKCPKQHPMYVKSGSAECVACKRETSFHLHCRSCVNYTVCLACGLSELSLTQCNNGGDLLWQRDDSTCVRCSQDSSGFKCVCCDLFICDRVCTEYPLKTKGIVKILEFKYLFEIEYFTYFPQINKAFFLSGDNLCTFDLNSNKVEKTVEIGEGTRCLLKLDSNHLLIVKKEVIELFNVGVETVLNKISLRFEHLTVIEDSFVFSNQGIMGVKDIESLVKFEKNELNKEDFSKIVEFKGEIVGFDLKKEFLITAETKNKLDSVHFPINSTVFSIDYKISDWFGKETVSLKLSSFCGKLNKNIEIEVNGVNTLVFDEEKIISCSRTRIKEICKFQNHILSLKNGENYEGLFKLGRKKGLLREKSVIELYGEGEDSDSTLFSSIIDVKRVVCGRDQYFTVEGLSAINLCILM